jgi:hypothetical protein
MSTMAKAFDLSFHTSGHDGPVRQYRLELDEAAATAMVWLDGELVAIGDLSIDTDTPEGSTVDEVEPVTRVAWRGSPGGRVLQVAARLIQRAWR